jgi:hypothetical protein
MHHYLQHAPQTTRSHAFYCTIPKIKAQCIHHTCDLPNPYNYINYIHSKINIYLLYKYSQWNIYKDGISPTSLFRIKIEVSQKVAKIFLRACRLPENFSLLPKSRAFFPKSGS